MNRSILYSTISIILLIAIVVQAVTAFIHNQTLHRRFVHHPEAYDYKTAVMQGNLDVNEVAKLFPTIEALPVYRLKDQIHTPVTIRYYHAIGDRTPAYSIEKGRRIQVREENRSLSQQVGYGLYSLPTHIAGWRLAFPFLAEEAAPRELLYVRLEDLNAAARAWIKDNPSLQNMRVTPRDATFLVDNQLYDSGVYLSSDLFLPMFPRSSFLLLGLMILSVGAWRMEQTRKRLRGTDHE